VCVWVWLGVYERCGEGNGGRWLVLDCVCEGLQHLGELLLCGLLAL